MDFIFVPYYVALEYLGGCYVLGLVFYVAYYAYFVGLEQFWVLNAVSLVLVICFGCLHLEEFVAGGMVVRVLVEKLVVGGHSVLESLDLLHLAEKIHW